jgi:hypothetical protein
MKYFVKYAIGAFFVQAALLLFTLITGVGGSVVFLVYMLPYLFLGILTGNTETSQETSFFRFVILLLIPALIYSTVIGLVGFLVKRTNQDLH